MTISEYTYFFYLIFAVFFFVVSKRSIKFAKSNHKF